jgi:hypothetical protein
MSLRSDLNGLQRRMGATGGECPGVLPGTMTTFRYGEPEPEPPLCTLCGEHHWPVGHTLVCEVVVKTREEAAYWREQIADDPETAKSGDRSTEAKGIAPRDV